MEREGWGEREREDEEALTLLKQKVAITGPCTSYWFHPTTVETFLCL